MRTLTAAVTTAALLAATSACGSEPEGSAQEQSTTTAVVQTGSTTTTAPAEILEPSGTLRIGEFAPVNSYDPARAQTAQSTYLYPVYDTLLRQNSDFELIPHLATAWEALDSNTWRFDLRDDVAFHDGTPFDAEVVKANLDRQKATEGNPNASVFAPMSEVTIVDKYTVDVSFSVPSPAFPLEMSMVMGMMVSQASLEEDLTRSPAGSGAWIWSATDSQAGVVEVFELNPDYWAPELQGVERIEVQTIADNNARANALLAGDIDIASTVRDAQYALAEQAGMNVLSVPAVLHFLLIADRTGDQFAPLGDLRVRQAIGYAIDREGYVATVHAGLGESVGGFYGPAIAEWHSPALDSAFDYDLTRARALLTEAGYPDGFTVKMPTMPPIASQVDAIAQMLGQIGITVEQDQIPAGAIGGYVRGGNAAITWYRGLLYYPGKTFGDFFGPALNPFKLDDNDDLRELVAEANATLDFDRRKAIFDQVGSELMERGVAFPLAHAGQNIAWSSAVSGVVMGLNMQGPMPYGVRIDR